TVTQMNGSQMHPPSRQVAHNRLADELCKARGKRRAGHRHRFGEGSDRPRLFRLLVYESDGTANPLVLKGGQPAGLLLWILPDPGGDGLDHQNVRQPSDDGLPARVDTLRLDGHEANGAVYPLHRMVTDGLDVYDFRQVGGQMAGLGVIEVKVAADEGGQGTAAAIFDERVALADSLARNGGRTDRPSGRIAREAVPFSVEDHGQIAGFQDAGFRAFDFQPTASRNHEMKIEILP